MGARRETRVDVALRSVWARGLVALAVAYVVVTAWLAAFRYFHDTLDMPFLAWPAGIMSAVGLYALVGLAFRRFGPKAAPIRMSAGNLEHNVRRRLEALDPLSHRLHPLGSPFPVAVVSRSGVHVVTHATLSGSLTADGDEVRLNGGVLHDDHHAEVRRLVPTLREVVANAELDLPVHGVVVVDDSVVVPAVLQTSVRDVQLVHVDQLPDVVSFAPVGRVTDAALALDALERWRPAHARI